MSNWIRGTSTSTFPCDAYGVDTDNPPTAYERLDNVLNPQGERAIQDGYNDWLDQTAREYFDVSDWSEDEWDAWREIVRDKTY